jgi:hypothetical protein
VAKTGDPNGDKAVQWPAYTRADDAYLILDRPVESGKGLRKEACDLLESAGDGKKGRLKSVALYEQTDAQVPSTKYSP